ncbi:MAG TPA: hypothetical protein VFT96_04980 [Gemmatimonadaceae bacterium]|nr:hypothetical protein [Gemmatimonadaceae bacterium]
MAARAKRAPAAEAPRRIEQIELFPEPVRVEPLDPRRLAGDGTTAIAVYRVTIGHGGDAHLVYHDRHGMYCEVHGRECRAARAVAAQ